MMPRERKSVRCVIPGWLVLQEVSGLAGGPWGLVPSYFLIWALVPECRL